MRAHTRGEGKINNLYKEIQKETQVSKDEKGYIISKDGKTFKIEGKGSSINPWDVRKINKNLSGDVTFIHSHPSDIGFGPSDIALFILSSKIRKMGVITKDGTIYEVEKPKDVQKYSFNDIDKAKQRYKNAITRAIHKEQLRDSEAIDYAINYFSDKYKYNLKYSRKTINHDTKIDFIHTEDTLIELFNCVKKQVQIHVDFVNQHLDMVHDITGLGKLTSGQLEQVLALEEEIKKASQITPQTTKPLATPGFFNYPMTPVASSFIRGAGAYKGKLLLEFHHAKGRIWGFDVQGQGPEFFRELLNSGSKGGWVWDKILGKPSQYGMAKGKFFAYPEANGEMRFYTTPGAQFVHKFGRPAEFTYNPVGYLTTQAEYNVKSQTGKEWKEMLVEPWWGRGPIEQAKLRELQRTEAFKALGPELERIKTYEELRPLIERELRRSTFQDIQKMLRQKESKKDFKVFLQEILDAQMILTPVLHMDLTEDRWITKYGRHIWIKNWYTPEELNKYDPKTGAGLSEVEPWLRIDRSVDLGKEGWSLGLLNRTLEKFPLKLKNMINEFRVFNKITDHPSMMRDKGKIPRSYEKVGWDRTYDKVAGVYIPSENNAYISTKATPHTIQHELGHAVWYGMSERERKDFKNIWSVNRTNLMVMADQLWDKSKAKTGWAKETYEHKARAWEYEANDVGEFFAESFQRYYQAKRPAMVWQEPTRQKQPFPEVAAFFRRRMKKYEKED